MAALQGRLDSITREHGETYLDGIWPIFEPLKARRFDSLWNAFACKQKQELGPLCVDDNASYRYIFCR